MTLAQSLHDGHDRLLDFQLELSIIDNEPALCPKNALCYWYSPLLLTMEPCTTHKCCSTFTYTTSCIYHSNVNVTQEGR